MSVKHSPTRTDTASRIFQQKKQTEIDKIACARSVFHNKHFFLSFEAGSCVSNYSLK